MSDPWLILLFVSFLLPLLEAVLILIGTIYAVRNTIGGVNLLIGKGCLSVAITTPLVYYRVRGTWVVRNWTLTNIRGMSSSDNGGWYIVNHRDSFEQNFRDINLSWFTGI